MTDRVGDHEELRYGTLNRDYVATWSEASKTEPMWALNLMHYREKADYRDGREVDITGWEADNLYSPIEPLMMVGADIALVAIVVDQPAGSDVRWDRVAIVKYPYRNALAEMDSLPEFQAQHVHKDAGMARTIVAATFPQASTIDTDVAGSATHKSQLLLQFVTSADAPAVSLDGVAPLATFDCEGVIIGDGRTWAQARWSLVESATAEDISAAVAGLTVEGDQYVVLLKPQFGDFVKLVAASAR
jgi:hypothetical protein